MAATLTAFSFLMISKEGTAYTKLTDIISYPDLGSAPETVDTTTLSDFIKKAINGLQDPGAMEFPQLFTPEKYKELKALEGSEQKFAIWFGADSTGAPDGNVLKLKFTGNISTYITGGAVNEARKMTSSITLTSEIKPDAE